ncbi:hypothetical protein DdX_13515 [Ditylenchus destructor]|uniref:Uncharacterized protein n=1 Tax=Ditylenchus destructor TaxID=166010 RepID=A0AAD4MUB9_9BILA|nr:hypothetical protein DdX_13515 [Ditylenchus destructor]
MARYRSTSPIPAFSIKYSTISAGYSGHIPGEKWQVGSRIRYGHEDDPRVNHAVREPEHTDDTAISSDQSHTYDWDGNPVHITRKQSMSAGQDKKTASGDRVNEMPRYQSVTSPKQAGSPSNANTPIPSEPGRRSQSHGRQSRQSAKTDHSEEIVYEGFPKQILRRSNEGSVVSHPSRKSDAESHVRENKRDLKSVASTQLSDDRKSNESEEEAESAPGSKHESRSQDSTQRRDDREEKSDLQSIPESRGNEAGSNDEEVGYRSDELDMEDATSDKGSMIASQDSRVGSGDSRVGSGDSRVASPDSHKENSRQEAEQRRPESGDDNRESDPQVIPEILESEKRLNKETQTSIDLVKSLFENVENAKSSENFEAGKVLCKKNIAHSQAESDRAQKREQSEKGLRKVKSMNSVVCGREIEDLESPREECEEKVVIFHDSEGNLLECDDEDHPRYIICERFTPCPEDAQSGVEIEELETPRESQHENQHSEGQHTRTITPESEHGTEYSEQNASEAYPTQRSPEVNQSNYGKSQEMPPANSVISHPAAPKPEYQYVPQRYSIDKPPQGFDGLGLDEMQAGYWSEGQALKNIRAHQRSLRGLNAKNNSRPQHNWNNVNEEEEVALNGHANDDCAEEHQSHYTDQRQSSRQNGRFMRDTPIPGYSGHMTEIARLGVGKPFTEAAKESIKLQQSYQDILRGTFATTERTNADLK